MLAAVGLGELLWTLFVIYVILNVLIGTVVVIIDLFRSRDLSGLAKAAWVLALLVFPLITVLVYLVVRGDGIGDRALARAEPPTAPPPGYSSPASELQSAKALLDEGTISEEEYATMRARILA